MITTSQALDFETDTTYALDIPVDDQVQPAVGPETLTINVLDVVEEHVVVNLPDSTTVDVKTATCPTYFVLILPSCCCSSAKLLNLLPSSKIYA